MCTQYIDYRMPFFYFIRFQEIVTFSYLCFLIIFCCTLRSRLFSSRFELVSSGLSWLIKLCFSSISIMFQYRLLPHNVNGIIDIKARVYIPFFSISFHGKQRFQSSLKSILPPYPIDRGKDIFPHFEQSYIYAHTQQSITRI